MKLHTSTKQQYALIIAIFIVGIALAGLHLANTAAGTSSGEAAAGTRGFLDRSDSAANSTQTDADEQAAGSIQIVIKDFVFEPAEVTISPGTRVVWVNKDDAPHTATSTDNKFNSGGLDTDDQFSFVFNDAGDYSYFCLLHPHMRAVIKVR